MSDPSPSSDWATRTADSIERVVTTVRDRTTRPLLIAGRAIVFGLLAAVAGIAAVVLLWITLGRVLGILTGRAWLAHFISGPLFVIRGPVLLPLRPTAVQSPA